MKKSHFLPQPWRNLRNEKIVFLAVFAVSVCGIVVPRSLAQPEDTGALGPFVSEPVVPHVVDWYTQSLPVAKRWQPGDLVREVPLLETTPGKDQTFEDQGSESPTVPLNKSFHAEFAVPGVNIDGTGATGLIPPDTQGDVGPNHYVQVVNNEFQIFDKAGNSLLGPMLINSLWLGTSTDCEGEGFDPIALYDHLADRWLLSQVGTLADAFIVQCVAVSRTADPVNGGWFLYDFATPGVLNDYPKLAVWPDGYYMGSRRISGADAWAFDRAQMLNGKAASFVRFFDSGTFLLPSDLDGAILPPGGAPNVFARLVDGEELGGVDRLELFEFHVDWASPSSSTFTALPDLPTAPFDRAMCGFGLTTPCVPQPDTDQLLHTLTSVLMWRLQYRNFGSQQTLVTNHTVDVDDTDHAGIRWYELRKVGIGAWGIHQQGTYAPDAEHRWMGSIAMDGDRNIALGYSVSSNTTYPSIRYTGRRASDSLGTMTLAEQTIIAGGGSQTHGSGRWGDYSSMNVDPVDDLTFWYTQEYYEETSESDWRTRIASFVLLGSDCGPPATGDWIVTESCTFEGSATAPANVIVQNNAVLTIASGAVLNLDFTSFHLLVRQGSRVVVKFGGKID